ncbi:MAG: PAS domain S-box protein, partial [Proteobacteria bacterium]
MRWINSRGRAYGENGKAIRISGVLADITDRKNAQLNFERNVDVSPAILWITEKDGSCTYLSKQWYSYTGQTEKEALGFGWLKATHPEDQENAGRIFVEANSKQEPFSIEYRLRTFDGTYRWAIDAGNPRYDREGQFLGYAGTVFDIHDVKLVQDRLKESEAKFRTIADAMPQMVWSTLPNGFHDYYNKRWYQYTGVPEGSTDGDAWAGMLHPDDQQRAQAVWEQSLATGEPYEIEYRLRHYSGQYRWTLGRALPITDESGNITRWMGTCTDIHEQK